MSLRGNLFKVGIAAVAILMFLAYYHMSMRIEINSDMASGLLEARDIAKGNILLQGWTLSTVPFYFTELIWYASSIFIFGYSYKLNYIFSALYLVVLCAVMIMASENKKTGAVFTFFLIGSPVLFMAQNILTPVIHVGSYIFSILNYMLIKKYVEHGKSRTLFISYIAMSLLYFSDGVSLYLVLIPLVVTSVCFLLGVKIDKRWAISALVGIISYLSSIMMWKFFTAYGFFIPGLQETKFATTSELIKNISDFFEGVLSLYGAYFLGMNPKAPWAIQTILALVSLLIFFALLFLKLFRINSFKGHDIFLGVSTIIMPLAFIFSNISSGLSSFRYVLPLFIFGGIFISDNNAFGKLNKRTVYVVFSIFLISGILHIKETLNTSVPKKRYRDIDMALSSAGVSKGMASFWDASSVSVYGNAQIAPVYSDGKRLIRFNWLSKKDWYEEENRFVIIENKKMKESVISSFGNPDKIINAGGKEIYIWNKRIFSAK